MNTMYEVGCITSIKYQNIYGNIEYSLYFVTDYIVYQWHGEIVVTNIFVV